VRLVLVSQRVDVLPDRNERRDALDQKLVAFLSQCGLLAVPVPNRPEAVSALVASLPSAAGVVLSGGNDLAAYGGTAPERDETERGLREECLRRKWPMIGICRGLQFLAHEDGGTLARTDGHVAVRHPLIGQTGRTVNSYHGWAVVSCGSDWEVLARAADDSIEWARRRDVPILGIMWHPEREPVFDPEDVRLFRETFRG
jgi:putative glutamine amidotransferase